MFKNLQKLGKAFMLPISILPAAGLLLGVGGALSNPNTIKTYPFLDIPILQSIFKIMSSAGNVIFSNIALIMCVGLAIGLAKKDKGTVGLAALVGFIVMNASLGAMVDIFKPEGVEAIDTGVIGSIVIGCIVVFLHSKYGNIQLPQFLGFFGGSRFIPIISALCSIFIAGIFFLIWPSFQNVLVIIGGKIASLGAIGTFFYGFLLRLTGAVGLHHTIYPLFWYTELGGTAIVSGMEVVGAQNIFFAELADATHTGLYTHGTRFFAGRFATMMFGLPGACLAIYHCVKKSRKKLVLGLLFSAALTSFLTGITEPIEFMFLFVAPWLYVIHAFFDGVSFLLADVFSIRIGNTFSGGLIDFLLFGVFQGNDKTNWIYVIFIGIIWFFIYYFVFRFFIIKFNVQTPGREESSEDDFQDVKIETKNSIYDLSVLVLESLGGKENIEDCDACITRLRVSVKDVNKVDKQKIKDLGATAVFDVNGGVQAVFGAKADLIKNNINEILDKS